MRYRGGLGRRRPVVSFVLAMCTLFMTALLFSGVLDISVNLDAIAGNTLAVAGFMLMACVGAMLLWEW